jgi:hypothetical protein
MADIVTKTEGDALSRLIQLQAGRHEIRLNWTGKGVDDLVSLCNAHAVKARLAKHLWTGLRELMQMPELRELPEALQAQITSIVLKSQALTDLETESHAKRMALVALGEKPKGAI